MANLLTVRLALRNLRGRSTINPETSSLLSTKLRGVLAAFRSKRRRWPQAARALHRRVNQDRQYNQARNTPRRLELPRPHPSVWDKTRPMRRLCRHLGLLNRRSLPWRTSSRFGWNRHQGFRIRPLSRVVFHQRTRVSVTRLWRRQWQQTRCLLPLLLVMIADR